MQCIKCGRTLKVGRRGAVCKCSKPKKGKKLSAAKCKACEDRGYTYSNSSMGIVAPCTKCKNGKRINKQLDVARQNVGSCRMLSKQGVRV